MTDINFQGLPHLQLDGTAKHPVYATAGNGTKCGSQGRSLVYGYTSLTAGRPAELHTVRNKEPWLRLAARAKKQMWFAFLTDESACIGVGRAAATGHRLRLDGNTGVVAGHDAKDNDRDNGYKS
jgi:hypothetical protein